MARNSLDLTQLTGELHSSQEDAWVSRCTRRVFEVILKSSRRSVD